MFVLYGTASHDHKKDIYLLRTSQRILKCTFLIHLQIHNVFHCIILRSVLHSNILRSILKNIFSFETKEWTLTDILNCHCRLACSYALDCRDPIITTNTNKTALNKRGNTFKFNSRVNSNSGKWLYFVSSMHLNTPNFQIIECWEKQSKKSLEEFGRNDC